MPTIIQEDRNINFACNKNLLYGSEAELKRIYGFLTKTLFLINITLTESLA